jgi:hypothetical protein
MPEVDPWGDAPQPPKVKPAPVKRDNYEDSIQSLSTKYGVDPNLARMIMLTESSGNPTATSPKGAQGLMQLMPDTATRFGVKDRLDPQQNLDGGIQYLKYLQDRYPNDRNKVIAAYNAGEGAVDKANGVPNYPETQDYVKKVNAGAPAVDPWGDAPEDPWGDAPTSPAPKGAGGFLSRNVSGPMGQAAESANTSMRDIPKVFTDPAQEDEFRPLFSRDSQSSPSRIVGGASAFARRAGRLAGDVMSAAAEPISVGLAPFQKYIDPFMNAGTNIINATSGASQMRPGVQTNPDGTDRSWPQILAQPDAISTGSSDIDEVTKNAVPLLGFMGAAKIPGALKPSVYEPGVFGTEDRSKAAAPEAPPQPPGQPLLPAAPEQRLLPAARDVTGQPFQNIEGPTRQGTGDQAIQLPGDVRAGRPVPPSTGEIRDLPSAGMRARLAAKQAKEAAAPPTDNMPQGDGGKAFRDRFLTAIGEARAKGGGLPAQENAQQSRFLKFGEDSLAKAQEARTAGNWNAAERHEMDAQRALQWARSAAWEPGPPKPGGPETIGEEERQEADAGRPVIPAGLADPSDLGTSKEHDWLNPNEVAERVQDRQQGKVGTVTTSPTGEIIKGHQTNAAAEQLGVPVKREVMATASASETAAEKLAGHYLRDKEEPTPGRIGGDTPFTDGQQQGEKPFPTVKLPPEAMDTEHAGGQLPRQESADNPVITQGHVDPPVLAADDPARWGKDAQFIPPKAQEMIARYVADRNAKPDTTIALGKANTDAREGFFVHDLLQGGKKVGEVHTGIMSKADGTKSLYVDWMGSHHEAGDPLGANPELGLRGIRAVARELKRLYPNVDGITYSHEGGETGKNLGMKDVSVQADKIRPKPNSEAGMALPGAQNPSLWDTLKSEEGAVNVTQIHTWLKDFAKDALGDKDIYKGIFRFHHGALDEQADRNNAKMDQVRVSWNKRSVPASHAFADMVENGEADRLARGVTLSQNTQVLLNQGKTELTAADRALGMVLRSALDRGGRAVQGLGTGKLQHWVQNYFPHIWDIGGKPQDVIGKIFGNRPLAGPAGFLKPRSIPTTLEGIDKGLKPVTYNPVELALLRLHEMNRYIMGHRIAKEMGAKGLVQFVPHTNTFKPTGMSPLDDRVFSRPDGRYYAPQDVADLFNNSLSPGLESVRGVKGSVLRGAKELTTFGNMMELGLSAFHGTGTTLNAAYSDGALALEHAFNQGKFGEAAQDLARGTSVLGSAASNFRLGRQMQAERLNPGTNPQLRRLAQAWTDANGKTGVDANWTLNANQRMRTLWKGDWTSKLHASWKALPAAMEYTSRGIMKHYVPVMKQAAFARLASDILDRSSKEGWSKDMERRELGRAMDSIDNRFGQLRYENRFWSKMTTAAAQLLFRSPGWNLGTVDEFGGAATKDLGRQAARVVTGSRPVLTHRMAYALMMPVMHAAFSGIMNYMMTGQMPHDKDYIWPRNGTTRSDGSPGRWMLPDYVRDIAGYMTHPAQTVVGKASPVLSTAADLYQNKDFFGTQITDPDAGLGQKTWDRTKFGLKQAVPFSATNAQEIFEQGGSLPKAIVGGLGLTPAPGFVGKDKAESMADTYLQGQAPTRTQEQASARQANARVRSDYYSGKIGVGDVRAAASEGKITRANAKTIIQNRNVPPLVSEFKRLDLREALKVYEAGSPEEKARLGIFLRAKMANAKPENYNWDDWRTLRSRAMTDLRP